MVLVSLGLKGSTSCLAGSKYPGTGPSRPYSRLTFTPSLTSGMAMGMVAALSSQATAVP
jgi:hypothetical protein